MSVEVCTHGDTNARMKKIHFTTSELDLLLRLYHECRPRTTEEWETLTERFNCAEGKCGPTRSMASVRLRTYRLLKKTKADRETQQPCTLDVERDAELAAIHVILKSTVTGLHTALRRLEKLGYN